MEGKASPLFYLAWTVWTARPIFATIPSPVTVDEKVPLLDFSDSRKNYIDTVGTIHW